MGSAGESMSDGQRPPIAWSLLLTLAAVKLLLHVVSSAWVAYGWVGDEFYFLDCARHLAWGYVDHPPLSIAVLRLWTELLGTSLLVVRLVPALSGCATIVLAGLMARELGGGWVAQGLAGLGVLAGPIYLAMGGYYSMNPIDQTLWAVAAYLVLRLLNGGSPRTWIGLGVVLGLGLLNKLTVVWLGCGIFAGVLLTPERRWLATPWPWLAGAIALVIVAPYLLWQAQYGWPVLEFTRNATLEKNVPAPPLMFLRLHVLAMHPVTLPFWLIGLIYLFFAPEARPYRTLGWVWLTVFLILMASGTARTYYLAPALTIAIAAAGRAVERFGTRASMRWLPAAATALLILALATGAPMSIPLLSPNRYVAYERVLGLKPPPEAREEPSKLPLHFALRFHGPPLVRAVDAAYQSPSLDDREHVVILTDSFHEAGAINVLGAAAGLPSAIGIHNNYWLWGAEAAAGDAFLVVAPMDSKLLTLFRSVERAGKVDCGWCMPFLRNKAVYVCRDPHRPLREVWPELKKFI
jgi:hypothetical protein